MALKLVNGQWQTVNEEDKKKTPTSTSVIPKPATSITPSTQTPLTTQKDPQLLLKTLGDFALGLVPGASQFKSAYEPGLTNQEKLSRITQAANPMRGPIDFVKGLVGIPARAGLSISDAFGGPKQANIPLIGPQQSYQEVGRQIQQEGGGRVLSTGVPILYGLADALFGKFGKKVLGGGKLPVEAPVTEAPKPTTEAIVPKPAGYYGDQFLASQEKPAIPKPQPPQGLAGEARKSIPDSLARKGVSTVWHQTDPQMAHDIVFSSTDKTGLNVATTPELALGQKGKGALIEMETSQLAGRGINKPSSSFVANQTGQWPEYRLDASPSQLAPHVKSITFDEPLSSMGERRFFGLQDDWKATKEILPNGKIKYTNPDFYNKAVVPKPKELPIPGDQLTNEQLAMEALQRSRGELLPWETAGETTPVTPEVPAATSATLDRIVPPKEGIIKKTGAYLGEINPYRFESTRIQKMGPAGEELVMRGRRASHTAIIETGKLNAMNERLGLNKLPEEQWTNLRGVLEGREQPATPEIANLATQLRSFFNQYAQETQVNVAENYFPRRLNEAGRKFYNLPENRSVLLDRLEQEGYSRTDANSIVSNGLRRGGFEFERILPDVPDQYRATPLDELHQYQAEVARRKGIIEQFGPKDQIAQKLINDIGRGDVKEADMKTQAQAYVDRLAGRTSTSTAADPIYNFMKSAMVVSKINPTTTIANELQAHINSYLDYGVKGLADATFGRGGNTLVKELGLDQVRGKFDTDLEASNFASRWMKVVGMEGSEIRGFERTAVSTKNAIQRAFETLKKDPTNTQALKLLHDHAMFIDDASLTRSLLKGEIPPEEMQFGIVEGIRRKMFFNTPGERPAWATKGLGSASYTFKNYINSQLKLLAQAPPHRQLAYMMVLAPTTGLPILVLRRLIAGQPLPDNPLDWYASAATAGPGTPIDIVRSLGINAPGYFEGSLQPLFDLIASKNKPKTLIKHTVPLQGLFLNRLFPPKR